MTGGNLFEGQNLDTGMVIGGMRVLVSDYLTDFDLVRRTWKERLFARPWRPWKKYKQIEKPPPYYVNEAQRVIYTTQRGWLALKAETKLRAH
jgi:hypothetical protein